MAYNNFYSPYSPVYGAPAPSYQQTPQLYQQQPQQAQNGILWVQGEGGAKAYPVAPNQTVQLWDSEAQVIYLKSADMSGLPSMKVLDYTIRQPGSSAQIAEKAQAIDTSVFVTRDEFEKRLSEIGGKKNAE